MVIDHPFGVPVADPYRWLEDGTAPETIAWMRTEDDFARARLAALPERDELARRLGTLVHRERDGVPVFRGARAFFTHASARDERPALYVRDSSAGGASRDRVIVSPATWTEEAHSALGMWQPSRDGSKVAYEVKRHNGDEATLRVVDVATGAVSALDVLPGVRQASPQWTPRGDAFYYVRYPSTPAAPGEVRLHRLGTEATSDVLVRPAMQNQDWLDVELDPSGRWLVASVWFGFSDDDVYVMDLAAKTPAWTPVTVGRHAHVVAHALGDALVLLSSDGAPNGALYTVDLAHPDRAAWRQIVAENPTATLLSTTVVGGHIALVYLEDVASRVEIRTLDGALARVLPTQPFSTLHSLTGSPDRDEIAYEVESFTQPSEVFQSSVRTGDTRRWSASPHDSTLDAFETEQRFYASKDGTRIPIFLVHAKGFRREGTAPVLLHGYGGYGWAQRPSFDPAVIPWLEHGGVYAVANLRGGSEYGERWHEAGMRHRKQNVFDDFIAAAEYLVRERYARADGVAIRGTSNGGLTVAAAITQRPDLFRAALCDVPLTDMVRFHLARKGTPEELGTPEDESDFRALLAYSPYHHVRPGVRYPAVLVTTGALDDRGNPMHARKLAAALQAASIGDDVLLRVEWTAGHHGSDVASIEAARNADELAFLLSHTKPR